MSTTTTASPTHTMESARPEPIRENEHEAAAQNVQSVALPSETAQPTRVNSLPQQASTSPGDGGEVHENKVPFKEQVIGISKKTRGTLLGNEELKAEGEAILSGKESFFDNLHAKSTD